MPPPQYATIHSHASEQLIMMQITRLLFQQYIRSVLGLSSYMASGQLHWSFIINQDFTGDAAGHFNPIPTWEECSINDTTENP